MLVAGDTAPHLRTNPSPISSIGPTKLPGYPDISGVKANSKVAGVFDHDTSEVRRDIPGDLNRGYHR